jgi:hypothetical protein
MATTYHRWFILPMETYDETDGAGNTIQVREPKLVGQDDRLDGFTSAGPLTRQHVSDAGYDHLLAHNEAEEWYVVVAWGEGTDAWNALNEIHAFYHDTETLADHGQDVKPVLNQRFGDGNWTVDALALDYSTNSG